MMLLAIKNENRGNGDFRTFGDVSNNQHVFEWNVTHGAYCYEPKSQQESDDIISTNWVCLAHPWRVAPIWDTQPPKAHGAIPATNVIAVSISRIPPYVPKVIYSQYPVRDLIDLCADAGFTPDGDTSKADNLRLQLDRYYEGRAWAVEDLKRLREKITALEALEALQKTISAMKPPAQPLPIPAVTDSPTLITPIPAPVTLARAISKLPAKRGRPKKMREIVFA